MKLRRRALLRAVAAAPGLWFGTAGCRRGSRLFLYNWGDYLSPAVVAAFERETGAELVEDYYRAELELSAKLRAGATYDVVVTIDYLLSGLQRDGLLRPLRWPLAGAEHLDPDFPAWAARADRGGEVFAVPYLWGTTGIGYDSDRVATPTSWNALFDSRYAGRITVLDSKGDVLDQGLLACGFGINSTDKAALREVVWPRLRAQKPLLRAYDGDPARGLVAGETWLAQIDSGDLLRAQAQRPSLRYVIPDEGAAVWTDYLALGARARQPALAERFLEFLLRPEIAAENANELRFATPNKTAFQRGLVRDADDPHVYPPPEQRGRLFRSEDWEGETGRLSDEIWLDLRSA